MYKSSKRLRQFRFYTGHILGSLIPGAIFRSRREKILERAAQSLNVYSLKRLNYYIKLTGPFALSSKAKSISEAGKGDPFVYYCDLMDVMRYFPPELKISYQFGDVIDIPETPTFLKSRPIAGANSNSVILRLNTIRHFVFVDDIMPFEAKKNTVAWRGKSFAKPERMAFIQRYWKEKNCDIGDSDKRNINLPGYKGYMSVADHLKNKFIISIEGNDVATNLKWILSSNSLCLMPVPRYETWFCEGWLHPGVHYVPLKDDLSDIQEKMDYYIQHTDEAKSIIKNAKQHVVPFRDRENELLLSLMVAAKYFRLSGQLD